MATAFPRETLRELIMSLTGFPASAVRYTNEAEGFVGPKLGKIRKLILNVVSRQALGNDETRRTYNEDTEMLDEETGGQRMATVSIRCESHSQNDLAHDILEDLRIRLAMPATQERLNAADVAFSDMSDITTIPNYSIDNREISVASMDLMLGYVASVEADGNGTQDGAPWIEKVSHTHPADAEAAPVVDLEFTEHE